MKAKNRQPATWSTINPFFLILDAVIIIAAGLVGCIDGIIRWIEDLAEEKRRTKKGGFSN